MAASGLKTDGADTFALFLSVNIIWILLIMFSFYKTDGIGKLLAPRDIQDQPIGSDKY